MKEKKLIFILSLGRSGSTLLQRMLGANPAIDTVSEPWLMLPLAHMLIPGGTLSVYNHTSTVRAIEDLIETLPNKREDLLEAMRVFANTVYSKAGATSGATYFLDKTPKYYLIIPFLAELFPEAKFIFLFRNPLDAMASHITTFHKDRLILYEAYVGTFHGPKALADGYDLLKERSARVNYEELVAKPEAVIKGLCEYLDIPFDAAMVEKQGGVKLKGGLGDRVEKDGPEEITTSSVGNWKKVLNTRYRKRFAARYLDLLGSEVLETFGFSKDELKREIAPIKPRAGSISDAFYHFSSLSLVWFSRLNAYIRRSFYARGLDSSRRKKALKEVFRAPFT